MLKIKNTISLIAFISGLLVCFAAPNSVAAQFKSQKPVEVTIETQNNVAQIAPANDNFANAEVLTGSATGDLTANNATATKEPGEPNHAGAVGGRSVWYKWTPSNPNSLGITFTTRSLTTSFDTVVAVYTGTSVNALTLIASSDDYGATPTTATSTLFFPTVPGTTYYIAVDGFGSASGDFRLTRDVNRIHARSSNVAGAGSSVVSVFRPSTGFWYATGSNGFQSKQFGASGDIPAPADYDGDNITDFAVFRPSNGVWYITTSRDNAFFAIQYGSSGDKPVAGDYSADGYDEIAVFRPSNGTWYVRGAAAAGVQFGAATDKTVSRDYDGDGKLDIAVFRPSNGLWYILSSYTSSLKTQQWGSEGDIPVPGEYAVDGKADIAVWRPSNGTWYALYSFNNTAFIRQWGAPGDIPQPIDYGTNRGLSDLGVYRPSNGTWYIQDYSGSGQIFAVQFGAPGDIPIATLYSTEQ